MEIQVLMENMSGYKFKVKNIQEASDIFDKFCEHNNLVRSKEKGFEFCASKIGEKRFYMCVYNSEGGTLLKDSEV